MASLYGIESEQDCRSAIDDFLQSPALHGDTDKETVAALKSQLKEYYKKGTGDTAQRQMSKVERAYFWPAIQEAYAHAPNLASRSTWPSGLYDIEDYLRHHRPTEKASSKT